MPAHLERAFVWWAHAVRGTARPDAHALRTELGRVHALGRAHAVSRANTCGRTDERTDRRIAHVDVTTVLRTTPIASRIVTLAELETVLPGGVLVVEVPFSSDEMLLGFERRLLSTGAVALGVDLSRTRVEVAVPVGRLGASHAVTEGPAASVPEALAPVVASSRVLSVRADTVRLAESVRNAVGARVHRWREGS